MRFSHRPFDLRELVIKVIASYTTKLADTRITLVQEIPDLPFPAFGDDLKLGRAMQHILDNACKFTPTSGTIGVRLRALTGTQSYEVFVADSGPGIPEAQLSQVFAPFFQVDGSPTRQFGGVGLGLAVAKKVAQALGGEVTAVSHAQEPIRGMMLPGAGFYLSIAMQAPEDVTRM
jgi:signal transduction histidine kinase